jgi:hypothetical protein
MPDGNTEVNTKINSKINSDGRTIQRMNRIRRIKPARRENKSAMPDTRDDGGLGSEQIRMIR